MKKFAVLIFMFFAAIIFGQKTISGVVKDSDGPVSSASVTVEESGKDAIIAYGITNSKGEYKLTFTSPANSVDLKVKSFNHKPATENLSNDNHTKNFTLESDATEIQEVKFKTKIITKKGDTISYDLKAFDSKADRSLADVLKKMPGMEVNPDGTVLYQGTPINKFYVNGKDLMEGSYGTISNSLPKDAVKKVEVMENHQPVKILQDKVPSDQAALNVVLKNSVTMTGRGEVGSGFGEPWLWNVKLTPMFFGQKSQWVVNYKTNNTGETVENEANMLAFGSSWEGRRKQASQNDWLNLETAGTPPNIPEKRYLFNNVHYLSANVLLNPFKNKEWELKANSNYTNNVVSREAYRETHDHQLNADYFTNIQNKFYTDKLKGELIFTKNAKKGFFKNTTSFTQFWNADRATVNRTDKLGAHFAEQAVESPTSDFQNSLSTIIPWKNKLVNFMSFVEYQKDHQNLDISPANYLAFDRLRTDSTFVPYTFNQNFVRQNLGVKTFTANHSANLGFTAKNWTFTPEVGFNYSNIRLNTDVSGIDFAAMNADPLNVSPFHPSDYVNDLKFSNAIPYASLGINYKSDSWMVYSRIPLNFNHIKAEDAARNVDKSLNKLTVEPNIFAQYSFASFWKASVNAGYSYNFGDESNVFGGYMLQSPTSISAMNPQNPILETSSKSAGARIEYRNPLNNIFFNLGYRISENWRNLISAPFVNDLGYVVSDYKALENKSNSNGFNGEFGKYFPKFKTNASVTYGNTESKSQILRNNKLFNSRSNTQSVGFKFNNSYFSWLSVDFNMNYNWRKQNSGYGSEVKTRGYTHNLSLFVYPLENHTIGFNWDQMNSDNSVQKFNNPFYDLSYQYSWAKKKVDFELKLMNLANRKVYETYTVDVISDSYSRYALRPRSLMLTVKFNFK